MSISTVGLDLAKAVFQVHAVDKAGKVVLKKALKRAQVLPFQVRAFPALARGRLFARSANRLFCLDLAGAP